MDIHKSQALINTLQEQESISNTSARKVVEWSYENEEILAEWCDIAQCYKWLDTETYKYYRELNSWLTIPCIIFSTISGTAAFGIPNIPEAYQSIIPLFIGVITIGVGIITTIQQYYRFSELKETHRILAIAWDKLSRNIRIELAKAPQERIDARHFIKFSRMEFDRLMENSEIVPDSIIKKFNKVVSIETIDEDHKRNNKLLKKPDICNIIVSINEKRRIWFPQRMDFEEEMSNRSRSRGRRRRPRSQNYSRNNPNYIFDSLRNINENSLRNVTETDDEYNRFSVHSNSIHSPKPDTLQNSCELEQEILANKSYVISNANNGNIATIPIDTPIIPTTNDANININYGNNLIVTNETNV